MKFSSNIAGLKGPKTRFTKKSKIGESENVSAIILLGGRKEGAWGGSKNNYMARNRQCKVKIAFARGWRKAAERAEQVGSWKAVLTLHAP